MKTMLIIMLSICVNACVAKKGAEMSDATVGKKIDLPIDSKGQWTLLYFYPKDDTPGCTVQACAYRDSIDDFKKLNAQVVGVSKDDQESHDRFTKKFSLNFPLLSDPDRKLADALAVSGRDSFLISPDGIVKHVWRKVSPAETVQETLSALKGI